MPVGFGERLRRRPLRQTGRLFEHLVHGLAVEVAELSAGQHLLELEHFEEVELKITHVALVMAHDQRPPPSEWARA